MQRLGAAMAEVSGAEGAASALTQPVSELSQARASSSTGVERASRTAHQTGGLCQRLPGRLYRASHSARSSVSTTTPSTSSAEDSPGVEGNGGVGVAWKREL